MKKILPLIIACVSVERQPRGYEFETNEAIGMTKELFDQVNAEAEAAAQTIINPFYATKEDTPKIMGMPVLTVPGSGRKLFMMREVPLFLDDETEEGEG